MGPIGPMGLVGPIGLINVIQAQSGDGDNFDGS